MLRCVNMSLLLSRMASTTTITIHRISRGLLFYSVETHSHIFALKIINWNNLFAYLSEWWRRQRCKSHNTTGNRIWISYSSHIEWYVHLCYTKLSEWWRHNYIYGHTKLINTLIYVLKKTVFKTCIQCKWSNNVYFPTA